MTVSTLRPNATTSNTGALTGASAHAALSDDSDASFITFDSGEEVELTLTDLPLPSGAVIASAAQRVRVRTIGGSCVVQTDLGLLGGAGSVSLSLATPTFVTTSVYPGPLPGVPFTDAMLDGASLRVRQTAGSGDLRVYEAMVDVTYA